MKGASIKKINIRHIFPGLLPGFVTAHLFHHLVTALPVPLLPLIRDEYSLDYTRAGLLISAFSLASGFAQLPGGWLADRMGARLMITIGISGVAVAGLLVGLSSTYLTLMVFLVLMGLVSGGYHPAAPPLITASVEPNRRGRALGIHLVGGSTSFFLAPLVGAGIAAAWGWRSSFIGLAIPTFIFGVVFYVLLSRHPAMREINKPAEVSAEPPFPEHNRRSLLVVMVTSALVSAMSMSLNAFIPLFAVDRYGVSRETAAALLSIMYSCGLWVTPLGGYLSDRFGRIPVLLGAWLAIGPFIFLLNPVPYGLGIWLVLFAIGTANYIRMPVTESYIMRNTPKKRRSMMIGIYFFSGQEGSALLTPILGYLADRFGFYTSFSAVAVALMVSAIVSSVFLWGYKD